MVKASMNFRARTVHILYNLLLPLALLLGVVPWLLKMAKRGGLNSALLERVGVYDRDQESEPCAAVYVHAVSVGEVMVALKLIEKWRELHPSERFMLVPTTSTGYDVAKSKAPAGVRVVYSPIDLPMVLRRVFRRFEPKQIVLMESELWPNLLVLANKLEIHVGVANARLSDRSEARYQKLSWATAYYFSLFNKVAVQEQQDYDRWLGIGVPAESMQVTGSVKFDQQAAASEANRNPRFEGILGTLGFGRKVVMALSTHAGEELLIAEALMGMEEVLPVIIPRHAERGAEVQSELSTLGFDVVLRSDLHDPSGEKPVCLVVDSTGEMKDWVALADVAIIGKSLIGKGGQNPCEAIAASVPVIVGPNMQNFEPLVSRFLDREAVLLAEPTHRSIRAQVERCVNDEALCSQLVQAAQDVLASHDGASARTVELMKI